MPSVIPPGGRYRWFHKLRPVCLRQIAVLVGGIALYVAHRGGGAAAAVPSVLLNLSRWLIITSTFTFVFALYKVLTYVFCPRNTPWRLFGEGEV